MTDLIARLQSAAPYQQRELLWEAVKLAKDREWIDAHTYARSARFLDAAAYVDAALTLVPEGLEWKAGGNPGAVKYAGEAEIEHPKEGWAGCIETTGATPALALVIAALKARDATP